MYDYIILYASLFAGVAIGGIVLFLTYRTLSEQHKNSSEQLIKALENIKPTDDYQKLSDQVVDCNRSIITLSAELDSSKLQVSELRDIVETRYHRLRVRQNRAAKELREEAEEAEEDDEQGGELLIQELGGEVGSSLAQPRPRGGLVRKSGRTGSKYRR